MKVRDWNGLLSAFFMLILVTLTYPDRNDPARWWGHKYAWIVALAGCALGLHRAVRGPKNTSGV